MDAQWYSNDLKKKNQVAIIGFWKRDDDEEYFCYHYFYVPNPCVREYARSMRNSYIHKKTSEETTINVCEILFKGQDEVFMLFNPSPIDKKTLRPD